MSIPINTGSHIHTNRHNQREGEKTDTNRQSGMKEKQKKKLERSQQRKRENPIERFKFFCVCFLFVINPIAHEKLICLKVNQCPKKINRPHFGLCFFPFFPRPFILKLDQSQLCVDLECSHTTIAKDWRKKETYTHTHTQKYKKKTVWRKQKSGEINN